MDNLRLRNFRDEDFEAFHAMVSDYDVVKMLGSWPYPSDPEFTRMRMNTTEAQAGFVSVIEYDGKFAGTIGGVDGGLGYSLDQAFWGRGITTWAVREKIDEVFRMNAENTIKTYVWTDNPASATVLIKNGFEKIRELKDTCRARGGEVGAIEFALTRKDWAASQPLHIKTKRLVIEPLKINDAAALARMMNDVDIARMMQTIPHPFSEETAVKWIEKRPFNGSVGFVAKISLRDGTLIGFLGLGGDPVYTAYALGRKYWGQGYATEAMKAFLADVAEVYALEEIAAGAFMDNPASQRVLENLGFEKIGQKMHTAHGRLEEAPLFLYRLRSADIGKS